MRADRSEKLRAGVFVLVSLVLLATIFVLVAGMRVFKTTRTFVVRFSESVTGLEVSSIVRYQGVPVGRVSKIGFARGAFPEIDVVVELDPETPVKSDTSASLKPQGITGLYYIDLAGGSPEARPLPEGGTIVAGKSITFQVVQTLAEMGGLVKDVGTIAKNLNTLIEDNRDEIGAAVEEMTGAARDSREFLKEMTQFLSETRSDLGTTIENANRTLVKMRNFAEQPEFVGIPGRIDDFLDKAESLADNLNRKVESADIEGTLTSVRAMLERVERLEGEVVMAVRELRRGVTANVGVLSRSLLDLRQFTQDMKMLARELRDQPSRLFFDAPGSAGRKGR